MNFFSIYFFLYRGAENRRPIIGDVAGSEYAEIRIGEVGPPPEPEPEEEEEVIKRERAMHSWQLTRSCLFGELCQLQFHFIHSLRKDIHELSETCAQLCLLVSMLFVKLPKERERGEGGGRERGGERERENGDRESEREWRQRGRER